jgi:sugar/nucleoside kinase (ribokinase family)
MSRISVIGNVNIDLVVWPAAELPPPGAEVQVETIGMRAAGSAGNSALALARLGQAPHLAGCVGGDHFGRFILEELCGYFTLPALRGAPTIGLMNRVRAAGGRIFFDSDWDPEGWSHESRDEVSRLLPLVDVFLPSGEEARGLTGLEDTAAARELQQISGGSVVVKLGPEGCLALGPGDVRRIPAPSVRVSDTTGAGDSFNGGLMYALSRVAEWPEALRFATRLASTVVSRPSEDRYPTPEEIIPMT